MYIKSNERGRPKKRTNLINERKKRTYVDQNGVEKRWTQKYLAEYIEKNYGKKITAQHLAEIERGRNNPSLKLLSILSDLFDKTAEEILS